MLMELFYKTELYEIYCTYGLYGLFSILYHMFWFLYGLREVDRGYVIGNLYENYGGHFDGYFELRFKKKLSDIHKQLIKLKWFS
jgi:hypothetical protein